MAIKEGYKQTEVGMVPEDWEVFQLSEITYKIMVGIASAATHAYRKKGVVLFRNQNIKANYLDDSDILYIHKEYEEQFKAKRLKTGDLITARTGYPGTTCVIPNLYNDSQSFTTLISRPDKSIIDPYFLSYFINSDEGFAFFERSKIGGGQKNVNANILKTMPIPLPPTLQEQQAIATALSDVDALISGLEHLIAKKKAIKQGAMQELLTGKTRVQGFEGSGQYQQTEVGRIPVEWEVEEIKDLASITTGGSDTQDRVDDGIFPFYVRSEKVEKINTFSFDGEAILTSGDGVGVGKIFHYVNGKFDFHQRVYNIFNFRSDVNGKYLFFQFSTNFYDRVMSMTAKSSVDSVRREMISNMKIPLPKSPQEQTTIAQILSDMDEELAQLEEKKAKYEAVKQGMMQELLTGKIRLV